MTRDEVYARLTEVFHDVFDDETLTICDETTANDIEAWDSLEQVNLIVATENEFGITLKMADINKLKNVGAFVDVILKKTAKR